MNAMMDRMRSTKGQRSALMLRAGARSDQLRLRKEVPGPMAALRGMRREALKSYHQQMETATRENQRARICLRLSQ